MNSPLVIVTDTREKWFPVDADKSLAEHGYTWEGKDWHKNGKPVENLDFPKDVKQPDLPPVGYLERSEESLCWLRFHLWMVFNPGPPVFRGVGNHEGDWEMVQVGVDKHDGTPIQVVLSQHAEAQKRDYWHPNNSIGTRDDGSWFLRVYMALGSHALYFQPGERLGYGDTCDGKGRHLTPEWLDPGPWWKWKGRWGQDGPKSPGNQRGTPQTYSARQDK